MKILRLLVTFIVLNSIFIITSAQWTALNNSPLSASSLVVSGPNLISGEIMFGGIFVSTDTGSTWTPVTVGGNPIGEAVTGIVVSGSTVVASTDETGLYVSNDNGITWQASDSGISANNYTPDNVNFVSYTVSALAVSSSGIYAYADSGVYLSDDNGASWRRITDNLYKSVNSIATNGSLIFAGTSGGGVFVSAGNNDWTPVNTGLAVIPDSGRIPSNAYVRALAFNGTDIFAGTDSGVYQSSDYGSNWIRQNLGDADGRSFLFTASGIFVGTTQGLFLSADNGIHWNNLDEGEPLYQIDAVVVMDSDIYIAVDNDFVWRRPLSDIHFCTAHYILYPDTVVSHYWHVLDQSYGVGPLTYIWSWGDSTAVDTAAAPTHTYTDSSYYNICLTITDSTGCTANYCDSSTYIRSTQSSMITVQVDAQQSMVSSVPVTENTTFLSIYPNPASTQLLIKTTNFQPQWLTIYDMDGRKLTGQRFTPQLDISTLASGLYFIEVKGEEVTERMRFVKL